MTKMSARPRVLSGIRPTGYLHVGHLVGALENYAALQDRFECLYMIADWHALTSHYEDPSHLRDWSRENTACLIAAGVDPQKSVIFRQSDMPEHAELHLMLSMITPVPWLERVPTYKEQQEQVKDKDLSTYGFLGYPVLQAADILIYDAVAVPVGEDQVAHLELAREIARRFNHLYGETFLEPKAILTKFPRLPGPDRRKMSKSYGNAIELGADKEEVGKAIKRMFTDPQKIHLGDKGHPGECVVFAFHSAFNTAGVAEVESGCRDGTRGCVDCKKSLLDPMWERIRPVHEARAALLGDPAKLDGILADGARRARAIASVTLARARAAMKIR